MLEQAGILASPRSLSAQDPSHPKIQVNPRSQSAQDPSQPWMSSCLFGSCLFGIWLMFIWYLAHAYRGSPNYTKIMAQVKPPSRKLSNIYFNFSHLYLAHAHFSQSKKTHEPITCCTLFSALICCSYCLLVYFLLHFWVPWLQFSFLKLEKVLTISKLNK